MYLKRKKKVLLMAQAPPTFSQFCSLVRMQLLFVMSTGSVVNESCSCCGSLTDFFFFTPNFHLNCIVRELQSGVGDFFRENSQIDDDAVHFFFFFFVSSAFFGEKCD